MATTRRPARQPLRTTGSKILRYTVGASVFVNAFNPHEAGHAESLAILAAIQHAGDPVIVTNVCIALIKGSSVPVRSRFKPAIAEGSTARAVG